MAYQYIFCVLIGYGIGAINPSYFLAKLRGFDIREKGSGNAGASNALMLFGRFLGIACALFDIAKAFLAILLCKWLFPSLAFTLSVTGVACVVGHIFPFYMHFRGGKGLACIGGTILAFDWRVFLVMLGGEALFAILINYICFVPMTASVIFPIVYGVMARDLWGALILCLLIPLILYKHKENLVRIKRGEEMRLSFLWNKDKEIDRIRTPQIDE